MTPRELAREQAAAAKRIHFDRERDMVLAWHAAVFTRTEKMPSLQSVLMKMRSSNGPQTYDQMKSSLQFLSQVTGRKLREVTH
jgi:hypothetical protein